MKHAYSPDNFVRMCRHIATHRGMGEFGCFPESFRNNISKRNRSSYVTTSKTHSLTNVQFEEIVRQPCYYCGKEHRPPIHYNGLDRLDSTKRVYTTTSCVSCCGTCNMSKSRLTEQQFLDHCLRVARFNTANNKAAAAEEEEGEGEAQEVAAQH
eukprot:CAMPEP_0170183674 /NCGR_PEP_ID=MMETSP0040_2-20121228/31400_1 /TAXON_ID=641309 /ORGANISM="Lotharella oceanica, Strain CCMP622" /LENGTH=153 /DNA_ID=CAMNT_0010429493 /DNA_START=95 /DNA_END=556 /DNA_ORIENTATION=+